MFCSRPRRKHRTQLDTFMVSVIDSAEKGWGLYSYSEVARYLDVKQATLRTWFKQRGKSPPLLSGDVSKSVEEGSWLNFHDFIQAYAVKSLKDTGLKPRAVREAIFEAKQKYGLPYPLSMRGPTIYSDGRKVHIVPAGQDQPSELTGKQKRQVSWKEIITRYLTRIEFDAQTGMANKFVVFEKDYEDGHKRVTMEPNVNFGEPTVEGTGYRASTLKDALSAEGSEDAVIRIYEVDRGDVIIAVEAFKYAPELKAA